MTRWRRQTTRLYRSWSSPVEVFLGWEGFTAQTEALFSKGARNVPRIITIYNRFQLVTQLWIRENRKKSRKHQAKSTTQSSERVTMLSVFTNFSFERQPFKSVYTTILFDTYTVSPTAVFVVPPVGVSALLRAVSAIGSSSTLTKHHG